MVENFQEKKKKKNKKNKKKHQCLKLGRSSAGLKWLPNWLIQLLAVLLSSVNATSSQVGGGWNEIEMSFHC